jgi:hypothetical protein
VATLKQILDIPNLNFTKPTLFCKPTPPLSAKHYLIHTRKLVWQKFKFQVHAAISSNTLCA